MTNPWGGRPGTAAVVGIDLDAPKLPGENENGSGAGVVGGGSVSGQLPVLRPDGTVIRDGKPLDVDRIRRFSFSHKARGAIRGEFLITAATGIAPSLEARRAALTLADQVAVAICHIQAEPPFDVNADAALPTRCARHQRALAATVESAKRAGRTACTRPETARPLAGS